MSQMHKQQLELMKIVNQQNQPLMALFEKKASFTKYLPEKSPQDFANLF